MKITFILPANVLSGGIRVIGIVAAELVARGHDVQLYTQPHQQPSLRRRLRALMRYRRVLRATKNGPFLNAVRDRVTTLEANRPVTEADLPDADVVVATWREAAHWVNALSPQNGRRSISCRTMAPPAKRSNSSRRP